VEPLNCCEPDHEPLAEQVAADLEDHVNVALCPGRTDVGLTDNVTTGRTTVGGCVGGIDCVFPAPQLQRNNNQGNRRIETEKWIRNLVIARTCIGNPAFDEFWICSKIGPHKSGLFFHIANVITIT